MTGSMNMINWPAVIQFDGDDELVFIGSQSEWHNDAESLLYNHGGDDRLIDSSGQIFRLVRNEDGKLSAENSGNTLALDDFIRLVRIHASNSHRCCIEKIHFRDVHEGIMLIASMDEND
jgi:hypothetical protein